MRYMIGTGMGWLALPVLVLAFIAYVWVAERLVNRNVSTHEVEHAAELTKAA